ncbi:3-phosphoshikimate 1-carboxyvinyltransferase [uncultured Desulfobacterium sp.]|uniref:3-phosphoshikimate 1-carboxyvinyltransferase n=1 Tax=uncultured Desulfobacterium sp. TaxID=201089 RepID=A0A445MRV6_9BACT|nr:3-phosphoshikimate 1-carboxyvinyltransferase [uncultured Desulfobacterium sp.]
MKEIKPISNFNVTVAIPGSKSITHRAIIAASLATGKSLIRNFLDSEDTIFTAETLKKLGVDIAFEGNNLHVSGTGGKFIPLVGRKELFLGNSGTSFRLLLSVVALGQGEFVMTGTPRMLTRPIGALVTALNRLDVEASCINQNSCPPVLIMANGIRGGRTEIAGNQSSQYLSSLLLTGPCMNQGVEIEVIGELVSTPYVDITVDVMEQFGVKVERDNYSYFRVKPGKGYEAREYTIQGDASSASYFWAAAAITGGVVTTENIFPLSTRQGDICLLELLEKMGCRVERSSDRVTVHGGALSGIDADMGDLPDMVPTLAAVALFAEGKTHIRNVQHLRIKESDRLRAIALEWGKLGAKVEETDDGLIIYGKGDLKGTVVFPHNDHRIAMSLAVIGLKVHGVKIEDEACVGKSFPRFWELWDKF